MSATTTSPAATYTKLSDGSWGVRIQGSARDVRAGQTVRVTKKFGEQKTETVGRILSLGSGFVVATIVASARPAARTASRPARQRADYRILRDGTAGPMGGCSKCRQLGRMCRECEFDEFDC